MTHAEKRQEDWLQQLFASIDRKDAEAFAAFLAEDASFVFGNQPPVEGRAAIVAAVSDFFESVAALRHNVARVWEHGDSVVCNGEVTYTRHDGNEVSLPFADIFSMQGNLISDYRIYMDVTPLYADAG